MKAGIVGLPNVGKSTLFNCLSNAKAQSANFPFCTIEPNIGVVNVPDPRLEKLEELVKPERIQTATVDIVDIAGLVKGASKGEGLGNQFLGNIRECNAIIHVLRCFDNDNIVHVDGIESFQIFNRFGIGIDNVSHHQPPRLLGKKTDYFQFSVFVILEFRSDYGNF